MCQNENCLSTTIFTQKTLSVIFTCGLFPLFSASLVVISIEVGYQCVFSDIIDESQKQPPGCSVRKGVLRNFAKFTGKHLCQSLFSNKVAGLIPATLLKKRLWHRCFPPNFVKFLRTPF